MRPFEFITASDARHAAALLAEHGASARLLAGGTDLLVDLKHGAAAPKLIIDISRARDMKRIALTDTGLSIGALATHAEIMRSPLVHEHAPALVEAVHAVGAVQTRNLGTLGGNLVTGAPSMDGGPVLYALEAQLTLVRLAGRRQVPVAAFFVGPRKTVLQADELLTEIVVPAAHLGKPACFKKFGLRKGQALALVNVAASAWIDRDAHAFRAPRIALGAVAPTVMRAAQAEAYLENRTITPEAMFEAGRIAAEEARPISDFRARADYRRHLVVVLTRRALAGAYARGAREGEARSA